MKRRISTITVVIALLFSVIVANAQVTGSGTPGTVPVWTGDGTMLTDSRIQDSGSLVTVQVPVNVSGAVGVMGPISADDGSGNTAVLAGGLPGVGVGGQGNIGVQGQSSSGSGVKGISSSGTGVSGVSTSGTGVQGQLGAGFGPLPPAGVVGTCSAQQNCFGIYGEAQVASGFGHGIVGASNIGPDGAGVLGANSANGQGVRGDSPGGTGVQGHSNAPDGAGVNGYNTASTGPAYGVLGTSAGGTGVAGFGSFAGVNGGTDSAAGIGVIGYNNGGGLAGVFNGGVQINGTLTKSAGSFKIDHPLDPANRYLSHSFVESPDMMNIYNGVVVLDGKGEAWVALPDWFEQLNRDFRYQLTAIAAPAPKLYVANEISGNRFKIAGGKQGGKVSWQVTGVRKDAYAEAHRIKVEEDKPLGERGYYLHPEVFGQPPTKTVGNPGKARDDYAARSGNR
jgi:hypothetical protein